jgi:hypothetical protein
MPRKDCNAATTGASDHDGKNSMILASIRSNMLSRTQRHIKSLVVTPFLGL